MEPLQRFQDDGYKNWIKTTMALEYLKTRLGVFLENETETYHKELRSRLQRKGRECQSHCDHKTKDLCQVCKLWKDEIWKNHNVKGGLIYWNNCTPYLWPTEKWEVAKAYMPRGNTKHKLVNEFDISAFLNLMTFCQHFKAIVNNSSLIAVTNVRNQVMHSPNFRVEVEHLKTFLGRIKTLGEALERHDPGFKDLAKEIDELQNIDFSLKPQPAQEFLNMELNILKNKMKCLAQQLEGHRETAITPEDLQCVKVFLEGNRDLKEILLPEWEKLKEVQEEQGQQLDSLTGRVEKLEKNTLTPESGFGTEIMKYKNHLYELARERKWPEPIFSEKKESQGYLGVVTIKGQTFTGIWVCRSKVQAHQEVAKIALDHLDLETARDPGDAKPPVSQTHQSENVSLTGSLFFCSVTVDLDIEVVPEEGCSGLLEASESAYKKLAPLFGLDLPESGSSYKEAVLQYCQKHDVPLPKETITSGDFSLRLKGPITFHDSEGSTKKKLAQHRAAKAALQRLCGVLKMKKEVLKENYVGALNELQDALGLPRPEYNFPEPDGTGKGRTEEENGGQGGEIEKGQTKVSKVLGEGCRDISASELSTRSGTSDRHQDPAVSIGQMGHLPANQGLAATPLDSSVSMETQVTPPIPEEGSLYQASSQVTKSGSVIGSLQQAAVPSTSHAASKDLPSESEDSAPPPTKKFAQMICDEPIKDGGKFVGCVKVALKKTLAPSEASSQEGAVQAAYSNLMHALSLRSSTDGEKLAVMEFFSKTECPPPTEDSVITATGTHRCTLEIDGELTFHSSGGAAKKQQAEQQAAKEALRHVEGLLVGESSDLSGTKNYKGMLQELLAKHGGGSVMGYSAIETASGQVTKSSSVIGSLQQTAVPSTSQAASKDLPSEDSARPPTNSDGLINEVQRWLVILGLLPDSVVCEDVSTEQRYECSVDVSFRGFTFKNDKAFGSKKEASHCSYITLGVAGGICLPEESKPKAKVNQFFAQKATPLPKEVFDEPEAMKFSSSLRDITCVFTFSGGKESSEDTACLSACHQALSSISPLIGRCSPGVMPKSKEEAELRLKMLEGAGLTFSTGVQVEYKSSATLRFSGFCMEMKGQSNKKLTRTKLSARLLKLLANDTMSSTTTTSIRNALDEWFVKKGLDKPVFEDADDQFGTRVKFSAPCVCSYTDWQVSQERAEKRLLEELQSRLKVLSESD